ncbi:MAG: PaeR7I family type II restriction endonuclease [Paraprevotella sp.]|nr:PaeR7I family type II restriction endonuclease [Paraprevotella sp.]
MAKKFNIELNTQKAIKAFWNTKKKQLVKSGDSSNRGAVVGGKQLDGFLSLIKDACIEVGIPETCLYDKNNHIPGYYRSSNDWDFLIISPKGKLIAIIELKSQIGSYGNNFNNRTEEAIGNATDFWTAYREKQFPTYGTPWVGYLMLIGRDIKSTTPIRNYTNHYPVRSEFEDASYIDRYRILCEKLVTERLYTSSCLIWTADSTTYGNVTEDISIERFVKSLQGYLLGCKDEFE